MKSLVEQSVSIKGTNKGPRAKTIFDQADKSLPKYYDIAGLSGKVATVEYQYVEGQQICEQASSITIPAGLDELGVKQYIISAIALILNQ